LRADLVVVGGGPAGTTLATLVKKHAPGRRVVLLEMAGGPRHHIGESLLPGLVPVLKEMGVFEKIDAAGFPRKIGANYVWGRDRTPWENDFNDVNVEEMLRRHGALPEKIEYAWQVVRSRYDEILLQHAIESGVEVLRGVRAEAIIEEEGRVAGVVAAGPRGGRFRVRAPFTADCSGQNGFLSRFRRIRRHNPLLKNLAVYAYFKGARWKYRYNGHPDKTKIFVCSLKDGWLWYIPVSADVVSVGLVAPIEHLKKTGEEPRRVFERALKECSEVSGLLEGAERLKDFDGAGREVLTHQDWSYLNVAACGPGWLAAGDAAVFVDPILSSGVTLAHVSSHRAAYTLLTHWQEKDEGVRRLAWDDYNAYCRDSAAQFLALALFWYGNDRSAEAWWVRAKELHRARLPVDVGDQGAFISVSAGLTLHYERLLSAAELAAERRLRPEDSPFHENVLVPGGASRRAGAAPGRAPRLKHPHRVEYGFVAPQGEGRLRPVKRVRFLKSDTGDPVKDAINPRKNVTRWHLELLESIDGKREWAELRSEAARRGVPDWWLDGPAEVFLADLEAQGALEYRRVGSKVGGAR
jgi:clorobiocin biosynthesis protein Clo-hal